jgi:hypothetical protein
VSGVWICGWRHRPPYPPLRCDITGESALHSCRSLRGLRKK